MRDLIEQEVDDEAAYAAFDHVEKHAKELFNNIPDINPDLGKVCIQIFKDQIPRILKAVDDRDEREDVEGPGVCDVIFGLRYIYTVAAHFIGHLDVKKLPSFVAMNEIAKRKEVCPRACGGPRGVHEEAPIRRTAKQPEASQRRGRRVSPGHKHGSPFQGGL